MEKEKDFKDYLIKYKGAIIGGAIAIVLVCTGLFKLLLALTIVVAGIFVGHYVQNNKEEVKEKLKDFIDKF